MALPCRPLTRAAHAAASLGRRYASFDAKVVRLNRYGHPLTPGVLRGCADAQARVRAWEDASVSLPAPQHDARTLCSIDSVKLDSAAMGSTDVIVRIRAAAVTPRDFAHICGHTHTGGHSPAAPAAQGVVAGNEALGVVEAVGRDVKGLSPGDVVAASRPGAGVWATHSVSSADHWTKVAWDAKFPAEIAAVAAAPGVQASVLVQSLTHTHTAAGTDAFPATKPLARGDSIIVTGAETSEGIALVSAASHAGLAVIAVGGSSHTHTRVTHTHTSAPWPDVAAHLQANGARVAVQDTYARTRKFAAVLGDLPAPRAIVDSVGGVCVSACVRVAAQDATLVSTGNRSGAGLRLSAADILGRGITVRGFNLAAFLAGLSKPARDAAVGEALVHALTGDEDARKVKHMVAREKLADLHHALARAISSPDRRVVLVNE